MNEETLKLKLEIVLPNAVELLEGMLEQGDQPRDLVLRYFEAVYKHSLMDILTGAAQMEQMLEIERFPSEEHIDETNRRLDIVLSAISDSNIPLIPTEIEHYQKWRKEWEKVWEQNQWKTGRSLKSLAARRDATDEEERKRLFEVSEDQLII